jgi:hypothetical protein
MIMRVVEVLVMLWLAPHRVIAQGHIGCAFFFREPLKNLPILA